MPKSKGTIQYSILLMIIYTIITCILIGSVYHYWKQISTSKKVEPFKWKKVKKAVKKVEKTFFGSSSSSSSVVKAVVAAAPVAPVITYPNMNPPYVQSSGNILPTTVKVSTATSDTTLPTSTSVLSSYDDKL